MVEKINELRAKKKKVELGGGQKKIDGQHSKGKLTARERLNAFFDDATFVEIDAFVETRSIDFGMQDKKMPGDGVVTGYGNVDGRLVFASAQDFTVIGGSLGEMHAKKITKMMEIVFTDYFTIR